MYPENVTKEELIKQIELLKSELELEKSERKRLENELIYQKSKNFSFKKASNIGKFGYWELDLNTKFFTASETAKNIYGVDSNDISFEDVRKRALPEFHSLLQKNLSNLINENIPYNIEYKIQRLDGNIVDIHTIAEFDKEQNLVFGTIQDISEKKKLQELLEISNIKYQVLFDSFPLGISIFNKEGQIVESNRKAEELLGISKDEQNYRKIDAKEWKIIKNDGTEFPIDEYASVIALRENRLVENVEMGLFKPDNTVTWINVTATPLNIKDYGVVITYNDITKAKIEHNKLIESELKYRTIIDNSKIGVFQTKKDGEIIYANNAILRILRFDDFEDFASQKAPIRYKEPSKKDYMINQLNNYGKVENFEVIIYNKNNEEITVILNIALINDILHGTLLDISDRIKIENELKQSEERFRNIFNNAPIGIYRTNRNGDILMANPKLIQILGFDSFDDLNNRDIEYEGYEDSNVRKQFIKEIEEKGFVNNLEEIWKKKDGTNIFVNEHAKCYYNDLGNPLYYEGTVIDITDRKIAEERIKESEEKFREMADLLPQIVFEADMQGNLTYVNKQGYNLTGYSLNDNMIGKSTLDFYIPEDRNRAIENIKRSIINKKSSVSNEYKMLRKDGSSFPVLVYSSPIVKEEKPIGLRGIIVDITEIKETELAMLKLNKDLNESKQEIEINLHQKNALIEELTEIKEQLEITNATKDKFFSIIAHDLKNPIGNFKQFTELVYDSYDDFDEEELLQFLLLMKNSANNLYELLGNLLEWSRAQRGKIQYYPIETNLHILVDNVIAINKLNAQNKKIALINTSKMTSFVFADPNLINTVIRNLVSNSIKFTPEGGSVEIGAINAKLSEDSKSSDNSDEIHIYVKDSGVGMSKETLNKLFRIDETVTTTGTKNEKGTGLGLILCKEFIEMHKGKIWVESEVGKGSTFWFSLPG